MSGQRAATVVRDLRTLFTTGSNGDLSDGQLLERFLAGGDGTAEAAFETLVDRHGPMVLEICRSVLSDWHDAEDALQATFLVLTRRARSIRNGDALGAWLFGVARRVSARARLRAARRSERDRRWAERRGTTLVDSGTPPLCPELYEEIGRLPEKFRAPVILCHLEGHTYEQAASRLRCPVGTVQSRLARGLDRLRRRLTSRGLAPTAGALAALIAARPVSAAPASAVRQATVQAALMLAKGKPVTGIVSGAVVGLARAEARAHIMARTVSILLAMLAVGLGASAVGLGFGRGAAGVASAAPDGEQPETKPSGPVFVVVADKEGKPVAGVTVKALGQWQPPARTFVSGADGRVQIPEAKVGSHPFLALVARPDEKTLGWASLGFRDKSKGTADDPLRLTLLALTRKVEGSLIDTDGHPVANARLEVDGMHNEIDGHVQTFVSDVSQADWPLGETTSDASGRYVVTLPVKTGVSLRVYHRRYVGPGVWCRPEDNAFEPATMEPAGSVVGTVRDASGRPVAGVRLGAQLLDRHERILGGEWGTATTDTQGRFEIGAQPGVHNLLFLSAPGDKEAVAKAAEAIRVRARQDTRADLTVMKGRRLRGSVIDPDSKKGLAGVAVGYYGSDRPRSGAACRSTTTDAEGNFELSAPPGPAYVYIMDGPIGRRSNQDVTVPEDKDPEPVEIVAASEAEVQRRRREMGYMTKAEVRTETPAPSKTPATNGRTKEKPVQVKRTLTGRISDPEGRPVAGASVAFTERGFVSAMTDREGAYILEGLPVGELRVSLIVDHRAMRTETVKAEQETADFVIAAGEGIAKRAEAARVPRANDPATPPPAHERRNLVFVELGPVGNDPLNDGPGGNGNDLSRVPRGVRRFGPTWFQVGEKMVHLKSLRETQLPEKIEGLKVGASGTRLRFLHGTQLGGAVDKGTEIGAYVVHYSDKTEERIPITYGADLVNWWAFPRFQETPSAAEVGWVGTNEATDRSNGLAIRLFVSTWKNPHPDKVIESIDAVSKNTACDPFLVGITLEKR